MRLRAHLRRVLTASIAALALSASVVACGGADDPAPTSGAAADFGPTGDAAWQDIVDKAEQEGSVTFYSAQNTAQNEEVARRFEEAYGITVNVVRDVEANLQSKLGAEWTTGNVVADVVSQTGVGWVRSGGEAGRFAVPVGPAFDTAEYHRDVNFIDDHSFATAAAIVAFGWNTDRLPDGLTTIDDLLDPELAGGKVGIQEPVSASQVDFYQYLESNYGPNFLERLAAQQPRVYPGILPIAQALTSGEVAAGFSGALTDEVADGAPVDFGVPEKLWGARFYTSVLTAAPHPNAAQLLANFLVTPAGQTAYTRKTASVLPDVEGAVATVDRVAQQDLSKLTPESVDAYRARWKSLFVS
ncbi:ABC transporter substrate-binding protein [Rhodococcus sp. NPDC003318]|uniref:ABC transporter substrate-binding protein n=1 Tax=Rhodococcus sp. NPDC003318 TaxID=3364503 RepID=UPI0036BAF0A7